MASSTDVDLVFAVRRIGSTWSGVRSLLKTSTCSTSVPSDGRFAPCGGRFRWDGGVDAGIASSYRAEGCNSLIYRYKPQILAQLAIHGVIPKPTTPPTEARAVVNDI